MITKLASKIMEFDDGIWYRIGCICGCDESIDIEFSKQEISIEPEIEQYPSFNVSFHTKCYIDIWKRNTVKRLWKRLKIAAKILFQGRFTMENEFMFNDTQQIDGLIEVLTEGKKYITTRKRNL